MDMVNVVVCVKRTLDVTQLKADPETHAPLIADVPYRISDFDKNALEEAARIKEKYGGIFTVITAGTTEVKTILKEALAFGADQAYALADPAFAGSDALATAKILASGLRKIFPWDIILCGEGSVDEYNQQVGPRLAEALRIAQITYVSKLEIQSNKIIAERTLEDRTEVVEANFPVLITVGAEINQPRYPTMLQILAASKKPVAELNASDLDLRLEHVGAKGAAIQTIEIFAPIAQRKKIFVKNGLDDVAKELAKKLVEEGVIST